MHYQYKHAVLGGTFDHLHKGHEELLTRAFSQAEYITIGLSTPALYKTKVFSQTIEPYHTRKKNLLHFLKMKNWAKNVKIIPLSDKYGTSISDPSLEAIIVSEETRATAEHINTLRKEKGISPLTIICIPLLKGEDKTPISSEKIRRGKITTKGRSYPLLLTKYPKYHLPQKLRPMLQKPLGKIIQSRDLTFFNKTHPFITTVGDITTLTLLEENISPAIAFIDGKTRRQSIDSSLMQKYFEHIDYNLINKPGVINSGVASTYQDAENAYLSTKETQFIKVNGEEDLLALPAILLAPLGSYVLYGQHSLGIIAIYITPKLKQSAKKLLTQFHT